MSKLFCLVFTFLFHSMSGSTQSMVGFPPSTKWQQIDTDTVRVIFTKGAGEQAKHITSLVHHMAASKPITVGNEFKKLNIVLHSNTTLANGYVSLAPFRSEFYLLPGSNVFDFGNLPWHENLAIHEYRHAQQFNNAKNGFSKLLSYLFGESGQALGNNFSVPDWFWEGDAVHSETALTQGGRGRLSHFLSHYNSLWLEGKNYSWMKLRNGSFKDFVPNYYHLGYLLVNYGYLKYGKGFWKNVFHDATSFRGITYPMQKSIKRHSGKNFSVFQKDAFDYYKHKLGSKNNEILVHDKIVTSYYHPQRISPDSIIYLKTSYNKIPAFYIKNSRGEHKIALKSLGTEEWFSYKKNKIAYCVYSTNPRWGLQNYSDITILDINSGKEKKVTQKGKYYTPDFSPGGDSIVSISINDSLHTELHILDAADGKVIKKVRVRPNHFLFNPRFIDGERIVVSVRSNDGLMSLEILNLPSDKWEELLPPSVNTIGQPYVQGEKIYFTSNASSNDEGYVIDLTTRKMARLTNSKTGNYFFSAYGDTILYSGFTTQGLQLQKIEMPKLYWSEIEHTNNKDSSLVYPIAFEKPLTPVDTAREYTNTKYSKTTDMFNFHSWEPHADASEYGFSLQGNNILNTFASQVYYRYNENETSNTFGTALSYGGLFPELKAGIEYTNNRTLKLHGLFKSFNQVQAYVGYKIPLEFTKGKTFKSLYFGSDYVYQHSTASQQIKDSLADQNNSYLHHFLSWSHQLPMAAQDIFPKLGLRTALHYRHLTSTRGFQALGGIEASLPSVANHSIVLGAIIQHTDSTNTVFANRFSNSRGYKDSVFSKMWRVTANYHMPLFYPDWGFSNLLYVNRIRSNFFYDFTKVYSNDKKVNNSIRSMGTEIIFDIKLLNQFPLPLGIRYSYLFDQNFGSGSKHRFEIMIPISIIPD